MVADDTKLTASSTKARIFSLANLLVNYSTNIQPGEVVIIECFDIPHIMIEALISHVHHAGGHPIVWQKSWATLRALLKDAHAKEIDIAANAELLQMKQADAYISLRASLNFQELKDTPSKSLQVFQSNWLGKVHYAERVQNTKWCSGKWPTDVAAEAASMTFADFEDFYFRVCIGVDYSKRLS